MLEEPDGDDYGSTTGETSQSDRTAPRDKEEW
jgi:hypothetical protein